MGEPCQYVFRFNGDANSDEAVLDMGGELAMPGRGQVIERNEKLWKVVMVTTTVAPSPRSPFPVHHLFLTDNLRLPI